MQLHLGFLFALGVPLTKAWAPGARPLLRGHRDRNAAGPDRQIAVRRARCVCATQTSDKLEKLKTWLASKGVKGLKCKGALLPGFGQCLVACEDGIKKGETIFSIPASVHLSPSAVAETEVGKALTEHVEKDDEEAILSVGLLAELAKGESSEYWPYVNMMPSSDDISGLPLLWSDEERHKLLGGSHLDATVGQTRAALLDKWAEIEENVIPKHPELFPTEVFNLRGWLWANAMVLTRAFPFGSEQSLIPILDLANHVAGANTICSIGVQGDGDIEAALDADMLQGKDPLAVLTATADFAPGEQVFIDYGERGMRSSWEMFYLYGFVPGAGLKEWLATGGRPLYFEGIKPSDPLLMQKRAALEVLGAGDNAWEGTWLDLKPDHDQCVAMAPLLRFAHLATDVEYEDPKLGELVQKLASWGADARDIWTAMSKPFDAAIETRVAAQVTKQCEEALEKMPSVEELAAAAAPPKEDAEISGKAAVQAEKERLAARVLLGERSALEACIGVWKPKKESSEASLV